MKVLVTGANGFVGQALCETLVGQGYEVHGGVRRTNASLPPGVTPVCLPAIDDATDWTSALAGVDAIVHLAARVHVMADTAADPLAEFRRVNTEGTLRLARQAAERGVKRLVFVSSVKVNGESGHFSVGTTPAPEDPYGLSKWEAEQGLAALAREIGLEVVILRPPLIYGPGVSANFLKLMTAVAKGLPLPFGRVDNRRSLVFVGNFADAISKALVHPAAPGRAFLVSDGEDISTPELIRRLAAALGVAPRLLPIPPTLLLTAARLLGKGPQVSRLLGSLTVDSLPLRTALDWTPPFTMTQGLAATATWFKTRKVGQPR